MVREFWIQRTLVTKGQTVVSQYSVHTEWTAQMASDEYHHGDEIIRVVERPDDYVLITRDEFRKALEYGMDYAVTKKNIIDVATEYLFGPNAGRDGRE